MNSSPTVMSRIRVLVVAVAAFSAGAALSKGHAPQNGAQTPESAMICTNLVSGATWQIRIDYARSMVDSNPARIGSSEISWHDRSDGGRYTLDRKSGSLTASFASSTGGYFIHDRCNPEH